MNLPPPKRLEYIAQTESEAWMAFLYASLMVCSRPESPIAAISNLCISSAMLGGEKYELTYRPVEAIGNKIGHLALVNGAVDRVHYDDRKTLFTYCCKVALSDYIMNEHKKEFLHHIGGLLEITPKFLSMTIQVMWTFSQKNDCYRIRK